MGQQIDSISSCNYSTFANQLLDTFNPQDGEAPDSASTPKRFRQVPLSYAAAVSEPNDTRTPTPLTTTTSISSLTSNDIDCLYERMKHHICTDYGDKPSVNIEELENQVKLSSQEVKVVRQQLEETFQALSSRVDDIAMSINRQNVIILSMQKEFQMTMSEFSERLQLLYTTSNAHSNITPPTTTSAPRRWGEQSE
jgi:hypothetical protein